MSIPVLIGVLVLVCAFAARAGTRNTYVKRKLVLSVALAIGYLVSHGLSVWAGTPPGSLARSGPLRRCCWSWRPAT